MKYKFTKNAYGIQGMYGVEILDNRIEALREIAWWGWTPSEIRMIIDKSKALTENSKFEYQVEGSDFIISIYPDEVYFFDTHHKSVEADFVWSFSEFIDFMEKFENFVSENS
ncbi:MAG TPA: hypothetical protein VF602_07725 [Pedobacter sp.]|jgi:hypothetical protein